MSVVNISDYRKVEVGQAKTLTFPNAAPFFCTQCDFEAFKLYETGAIHCASCGAKINNLTVARP